MRKNGVRSNNPTLHHMIISLAARQFEDKVQSDVRMLDLTPLILEPLEIVYNK